MVLAHDGWFVPSPSQTQVSSAAALCSPCINSTVPLVLLSEIYVLFPQNLNLLLNINDSLVLLVHLNDWLVLDIHGSGCIVEC